MLESERQLPRGYRGLAEITGALRALQARGARVSECAVTLERRGVIAVELGPPRAKGLSVLLAGTSALEWCSVECAVGWLEQVAERPPTDRRVLAFPLLNADGYARVERELLLGERRFDVGNQRGVSLGRNWPTHFRPRPLVRALSADPGAEPLSEPETRGVAAALDRAIGVGAGELRTLALSGVGAHVLYPYAGSRARTRDQEQLRVAAVEVASKLGPPYVASQASRRVGATLAPGSELDHFYEAYGATSLTVACGASGVVASLPSTWRSPFAWSNPRDPREERLRLGHALDYFLLGR